ncbi:MAG: carboxymuconolactone decarboxylase family protein [Pseudomonadota bacterium]
MTLEVDRISAYAAAPNAMEAMQHVENYLADCGLEPSLAELVKMRVSQTNGCAFCLSLHSTDARRGGETEQRLYLLSAWRESSLYTPRERAALAWAEALTSVASTHAPDAVFGEAREHLTDEELTNLTLLVCQINSWNRFAIGFRYRHA